MSLKIPFAEKFQFLEKFNFSKSKSKQPVGFYIGSSSVKAVQLSPIRNGLYELVGYGYEDLPPNCVINGAIASPEPIADAIFSILSNKDFKSDNIVASISGQSVIVKKISIHLQDDEDMAEAVKWEAEQHLPFDIDDVNFDFQVLGKTAMTDMVEILFVAAKKDVIQSYANVFNLAKKNLVTLDVDAFALLNAYEFNYKPETDEVAALLNIGANATTINLVSGTEFLFTRDIGVGGQRYTEFLQKEFNISYEKAEALMYGETIEGVSQTDVQDVVDSVTEIICMEIHKTFDFFKSTSTVKKIDSVLVSGGSAHTPGLLEAFVGNFDIPAEEFDSFKRIFVDEKQFPMITEQAADMAIAVGLALRSSEE